MLQKSILIHLKKLPSENQHPEVKIEVRGKAPEYSFVNNVLAQTNLLHNTLMYNCCFCQYGIIFILLYFTQCASRH